MNYQTQTIEGQQIKEYLEAVVAAIEVPPQMEGRTMLVVMAPNKAAAPKKKEKPEQAETKNEA